MDLLSHYKETYHFEIQRSEIFDNRIQAPTAALIFLIGFMGYMFEKVNFNGEPLGVSIFVIPYFLAILATIVSTYFLKAAWGGSTYKFLPLPTELEEYREQLKSHYNEDDDGVNVVSTYKGTLINYYIECASFNSLVNEKRARKAYLGVAAMSTAAVLAVVSCVPYYSYGLKQEKPIAYELKQKDPVRVDLVKDSK